MPAIQPQVIKFVLWVQDMPRAIAFYRDVVGLSERFQSEHWTELAFGDAIVALHGGGNGARCDTGLSIQVADLVAACDAVTQGGGTIIEEPKSNPGEPIQIARLMDPEGNVFMMTRYTG